MTTHTIRRGARGPAHALAAGILAAVLLAAQVTGLLAAVDLARFEAAACPPCTRWPDQPNNTIRLEWETGSEINTLLFRLYRSDQSADGPWGEAIHTEPAGNEPAGRTYKYDDANVQVGVKYYYLLEDLSTTGTATKHDAVSAGIGLADNTPTPSPTPSLTPTASRTVAAATATTGVQPTVTRQFTNTPAPAATATTRPGAVLTPPRSNLATPTRSGPAVLATPTAAAGALPPVTAATPGAALATPAPAESVFVPPTPLPSPTAAIVAQISSTPGPSVTPRVDANATPAVFEAVGTRPGIMPTAQSGGGDVASRRSFGATLAVAGLVIVLAGLAGGAAFLIWRSRQ